ncbi:ankyrin repeat-containing domain protein [Coprinopsis sp. MPI-PUGE-AT-0042]|nr:ankyrin repeat-containing domain protein [Coprinopsis sp. MPI-PUGE-AT-0042]
MLASREGHEDIVTLLLARPEILINSVDNEGWSALMKVARRGYEGIAKQLLTRNEIQINLVADNGWSALMMAAFYGHEGMVKLLLAHPNILVDFADNEGWSSARLASTQERREAKRLAGSHIDTEIKSPDGHTAMSLALVNGHMGIVQLLQEFELLRAGPCTSDGLTLGDGV